MNFEEWIWPELERIENKLSKEARKLGLIQKDRYIKLKYEQKNRLSEFNSEAVYVAGLNDGDKEKILSGNWKPLARALLQELIEENPRKYGSDWKIQLPPQINEAFREAGLPWRVLSTGAWNERLVYLATTQMGTSEPIGRVLFHPNAKRKVF